MSRTVSVAVALLLWLQQTPAPPPQPESPVPATRLQTRWGEKLDRSNVLPEYPRPQLTETFLNHA